MSAGLLEAICSGASRPMAEVSAVVVVIAAVSSVVLWTTGLRPSFARTIAPGELLIGSIAVALTGGANSPFVFYLTSPIIDAAMTNRPRWWVSLVLLAAGGLLTASIYAGTYRPAVVDELALIVAVPSIVAMAAKGRNLASAAVSQEDRLHLERLARGMTYKEIAADARMSPETVKVQVARLYRRLGARTREEALTRGRDAGLI